MSLSISNCIFASFSKRLLLPIFEYEFFFSMVGESSAASWDIFISCFISWLFFLNEYKKMKSNDALKKNNVPKKMYNNSSSFLLNKEKEIEENGIKSYYIDILNVKIDKAYSEVNDLNLKK